MKNYTKKRNIEQPSKRYPLLLPRIAAIAYHIQELHKLSTTDALGEVFEISGQAIAQQINKVRKEFNG